MWMIAAPARAASMPEVAISSGVTGTAGFFPAVSAEPVRAQVMMVGVDIERILHSREEVRS